MGCCSATEIASLHPDAGELTVEGNKIAHERLRKMQHLDEATKIPFVMVELRGEAHEQGFVELCGKDEYGVYSALHDWLVDTWGCEQLESGDLSDDTQLPFSDRTYKWGGFKTDENSEGTTNMGLVTMQLVDFMCNKQGWTLGVVNGGNVGKIGEIREQQVIFKCPHPMNLAVPHFMVELRSAGYIEVCGGHGHAVLDELEQHFKKKYKAKRIRGHEKFCDRFYQVGERIFKERGNKGENNLGLLTIELVDFVCKDKPWSLVTMNGGNYGESGTHREQQLVFRLDNHPLGASPHLLVELRGAGFVEVNGEDVDDIYAKFHSWLTGSWGCQEVVSRADAEPFCNKKYRWKTIDMMDATGDVTAFFHEQGWQLLICSQGTVKIKGDDDSREQQMVFRPAESGFGIVEPHLVMDLYMGEGTEALYMQPEKTQVLSKQHIRLRAVGECSEAEEQFHQFMLDYLGGTPGEKAYSCDIFMSRGLTENNLGCWTMRICDFMVDRLGWSFVVCNVCNLGQYGQLREQQLIFRYDGERREIPVTRESELFSPERRGDYADFRPPNYWRQKPVLSGTKLQGLAACDDAETAALQDILDATFKRVLTRDRVYEYQAEVSEEMPYRLELVQAFRSENVPLTQRFQQRREAYSGSSQLEIKTRQAGAILNNRLGDGEALLFHGTNPSSSISILKGGFVLSNAGKSTGTMFGYGVYLAECCSKSDEYARDDGNGTYPGLRSIVVCRALVGQPYIIQEAGDHIEDAKEVGCDCVVGDREAKVGTYREFVFFDESQVLPEYSLIYKRQYNRDKVPEHLRTKAIGTTGRCWQVKLDRGWANIPPDINHKLLEAQKNGQAILNCKVGTFDYVFDLENKTQKNEQTQKVREMRPPRHG
mmetsp:Transcript_84461/g.196356  ORF Transcript_84461/g.196356 Transcript_84461/m.196356 type:complete len:879 (-) Transcript_84461:139-2775(-)